MVQDLYENVEFAAVNGAEWGYTDHLTPEIEFYPCCILLVEIIPGSVAIIITSDHFTNILSSVISLQWLVRADEKEQVLRISLRGRDIGEWIHLRLSDPVVFEKFLGQFADARLRNELHADYVRERLEFIAEAQPTNVLKYARKYLGDGYVDAMVDYPTAVTKSKLEDAAEVKSRDAVMRFAKVKSEDAAMRLNIKSEGSVMRFAKAKVNSEDPAAKVKSEDPAIRLTKFKSEDAVMRLANVKSEA